MRILFVLMLAISVAPAPALAGSSFSPEGSDTLNSSPLRILDHLAIYDICGCRTFCYAVIEPYSYKGSPIVPILGGVGSAELSCAVDTTLGTATFAPPSCITTNDWHFSGIGVIVGAPGACFQATLHRADGLQEGPEIICFGDGAATPAAPETWGEIKAAYR